MFSYFATLWNFLKSKALWIGAFLLAINVFYFGYYVGMNHAPTSVLVNEGYLLEAPGPSGETLDKMNIDKLINVLKQDKSQRLGLAVFTATGLYLAPNLPEEFEFLLGIRRRSDGMLMIGQGFEKGKILKVPER